MLPKVTLRDLSRDDVDRVAWWLDDEEVSSRWFGHYACGDPVHRGYDPRHMLEASGWEWDRVFGDPLRLILAVYDEAEDHIGECQVAFDGHGSSELSVLIGRKDLWHRGYGTAAVVDLLDKVFESYDLDRIWVRIPEDNKAALGLVEKLGFVREDTMELCTGPDGTPLHASILALDVRAYEARQRKGLSRPDTVSAVTVTGMPGSGAEALGIEVALLLGVRFFDEELSERLRGRLRCSEAELESLEQGHVSMWSRLLTAIAVPVEWPSASDGGYLVMRPEPLGHDDHLDREITEKQYQDALGSIVRQLCAEGNAVLNGHGSHLFAPAASGVLNVFVSASEETRERELAADHGLTLDEARSVRERLDRHTLAVAKNLYGGDPQDLARYDMAVNMDRLSVEAAARVIVGSLQDAAPTPMKLREEDSSRSLFPVG